MIDSRLNIHIASISMPKLRSVAEKLDIDIRYCCGVICRVGDIDLCL